ncbi:MAG: tRNA pseudouridine(55) synthase TruB [Clostridia bacterium]|nr:tRNA pseudouridine(55) synthase TruB [Clostridia bacterium]
MNGLILLDKPEGFTSFKAAAVLRRIYGTKRVGHTGTLDPMATGVLPILIGRATRLCSYVLEADKRYTAGVRLGVTTDTLDITGEVLSQSEVSIADEQLVDVLNHFTCTYDQIPPMFSAIKKDGVRLYDLARQGKEIERTPRTVTIHEIKLLSRNGNDFLIDVHCSKGTYIRSLADDIGKLLGCGATLISLRRTDAAGFSINDCKTLEQIEADPEGCLLSADRAVPGFRSLNVSEAQAKRFMNGAALSIDRLKFVGDPKEKEIFKIFSDGRFLGLSELDEISREISTKCVVLE